MASRADTANALEEFWRCYRDERFFEAHEVLEDAWRAQRGAERERLHGLIHCAVARYQHNRGNPEGAARQLARARARLGSEDAELLHEVAAAVGSSVESLDEAARKRLQRLEEELSHKGSTVEFDRTLED